MHEILFHFYLCLCLFCHNERTSKAHEGGRGGGGGEEYGRTHRITLPYRPEILGNCSYILCNSTQQVTGAKLGGSEDTSIKNGEYRNEFLKKNNARLGSRSDFFDKNELLFVYVSVEQKLIKPVKHLFVQAIRTFDLVKQMRRDA